MKKITQIIFISLFISTCLFSKETNKNILLITSYHNSLKWDIEFTEGIQKAKNNYDNIQLFKENLDFIRLNNFNEKNFYNYLKEKYKYTKIDAIITESDPAYTFIQNFGENLFGDIPYVYYTTVQRPTKFSKNFNITNFKALNTTLKYAIKQNPKANNIIIIDQENHKNIEYLLTSIKKDINIRNISNFTVEEMVNFTSSIDNLSFIFYTTYLKEPLGKNQNPVNVLKELYENSDIPIYSIYSRYLNKGIVGGEILETTLLTEELLRITNDLLEGNIDNNYNVTKKVFDNNILETFKLMIPTKEDNILILNTKEESYIKTLLKNFNKEIILVSSIFLIMVLLLLFSLYLSYSRKKLIDKLKIQNENIQKEKEEKDKTEKILVQQSKMAALGDMLQNIAHQWRQPLSVISTSASGIKVNKELDIKDEKFELESLDKILESSQYLSKTIDVFRNFFKPSNAKEFFNLKSVIEQVIYLSNIENNSFYQIDIEKDITDIEISSYKNEFIQALLNIINNSKDALLSKIDEGSKRLILITVHQKQNNIIVSIKDNAGGVNEENIEKIFQPYFTTKHKSKGTGIGLYMTNEIITKHMKGKIIVKNTTFTCNKHEYMGADFSIYIPFKF